MAFAAQHQDGSYTPTTHHTNLVGTTSTRVLLVDSRSRDVRRFPQASDFAVKLDEPLHEVTSIRLMTAIVPIYNPSVHPTVTGVAETSPYVVLRLEDMPAGDGIRGGTSEQSRNAIADDGAVGVIPMIPEISADVGGGVVAQYARWSESNARPSALYFRSPLAMLTHLHIRLAEWGESTQARSVSRTYPLPDETPPTAPSAPSGLLPQNNTVFVFEITSFHRRD